MADSFKTLNPSSDIQTSRTKLHEAIPVTGTIVSGTSATDTAIRAGYTDGYTQPNIKNPAHGMFQMVYDYPYLSSSANHIFDISTGYSTGSRLNNAANTQTTQKVQLYNQMAQVLMGHDVTGAIKTFNDKVGGKFGQTGAGRTMDSVYFVNFSRLLVKDEIQKGTFYMDLDLVHRYDGQRGDTIEPGEGKVGRQTKYALRVIDASGSNSYYVDSPAGEYAALYARSLLSGTIDENVLGETNRLAVGLLFYQAGVAVLSSSIFKTVTGSVDAVGHPSFCFSGGILQANLSGPAGPGNVEMQTPAGSPAYGAGIDNTLASSSVQTAADSLRHRIRNLYFANTTELNSTIHFCRANANEFNYSSNPTYLSSSQIRVKEDASDEPASYITTVGLYGADNELLATAKVSEPLKKTPSNEFTLRVRLDY